MAGEFEGSSLICERHNDDVRLNTATFDKTRHNVVRTLQGPPISAQRAVRCNQVTCNSRGLGRPCRLDSTQIRLNLCAATRLDSCGAGGRRTGLVPALARSHSILYFSFRVLYSNTSIHDEAWFTNKHIAVRGDTEL